MLPLRYGKENEMTFNFIGSCPHNILQITSRHHKVNHKLKYLPEREVYDEVFAVDEETQRFSDIIAFLRSTLQRYNSLRDPDHSIYEINDQD